MKNESWNLIDCAMLERNREQLVGTFVEPYFHVRCDMLEAAWPSWIAFQYQVRRIHDSPACPCLATKFTHHKC
jgi:hypothetical protein